MSYVKALHERVNLFEQLKLQLFVTIQILQRSLSFWPDLCFCLAPVHVREVPPYWGFSHFHFPALAHAVTMPCFIHQTWNSIARNYLSGILIPDLAVLCLEERSRPIKWQQHTLKLVLPLPSQHVYSCLDTLVFEIHLILKLTCSFCKYICLFCYFACPVFLWYFWPVL